MQPSRIMRVISVNVGLPREISSPTNTFSTAIYKHSVEGRVKVGFLNLEGDKQADLKNHGGREQAVYVYPSENYARWHQIIGHADLSWGTFGENLTTEDLLEDDVYIGDCYRIGSAEFTVTRPRIPCYKLGIRVGAPDIIKPFLISGYVGFYMAVLKEGDIGAGDEIIRISRPENSLTIRRVAEIVEKKDIEAMRQAVQLPTFEKRLRASFLRKIARVDAHS
jgi:MOSC domain-containing protein YiiM